MDRWPTGHRPDRLWAFFIDHLRPYRKVIAAISVTGALVALIETALIFYAGRLVDLMTAAGPERFLADHGFELALVVAMILVARPLAIFANLALLNLGLSLNLVDHVRWRAHRYLLRQSIGFFQNDFAGRIANRVMQTGPALEDSAYVALEAIWYFAAYLIGAFLVLGNAEPLLVMAAPYLAGGLPCGCSMPWCRQSALPPGACPTARSAVAGRVVDAYTNIHTVKLFAHAEREESYALTALRINRLRFARMLRLLTRMSAWLATLNGVLIVATVGTAVWLWMQQATTLGAVTAATALTLRLNAMTGWIMWVTTNLFQHAGVIKEGMQSISRPHDVVGPAICPRSVGWHGRDQLHGCVASLRPRQSRSAGRGAQWRHPAYPFRRACRSGRPLRCRQVDPVQPAAAFLRRRAGQDRDRWPGHSSRHPGLLRRAIAVVTQDTSLLHRSVRDNILYGRPDAGEADMRRAARLVFADEFIAGLEDPNGRTGYDAHVGERGVKLSGGQRQRIALARAVLKDAPILLLDEATSALDSGAESLIQQALGTLMQGKTVIAIAHRLSTIQSMDRIVVMDQGRIIEQGSHDPCSPPAASTPTLWTRQSGGSSMRANRGLLEQVTP